MAVPFLTGVDLTGQQILNACLQVLATAPANPGTGRTYFDSALGHARIWTGTAWEQSSGVSGGGGTVTTVSATVPAFLAVTVSNPTSTPGIAITSATGLAANQVLATPNGAAGTLGTRALVGADLPVFGPSGAGHAVGAVPDPGATAGTTRFLREDATWVAPSAGGTVTSVALALPALFTVTGSPVTTTGTLTATLAVQAANLVWAGPTTGAAVAPAFRALVAADIPKTLDTTWITNFAAGVTAIRLDQMAAPTAAVSMNGQRLTNLPDPVAANEPATKGYADAIQAGLDTKASVRAASTANVAGTYTATGGTSGRGQFTAMPNTLDGVTLAAGNRVLLKDQTAGAQNGIWVVTTLGTGANGVWDRAPDFDADAEVTAGAYTFVEEGTQADNGYQLITNNPITIGGTTGTALVWTQFSGAGQITAGAGMTKTGNTLDVGTASAARIVVNADNVDLATVVAAGTAVIVTYDAYGRVTAGADLIAAGGIPARTAANTYTARTITGTANQIAVTNGDGVAGNPTLAFAAGARTSLGAPGKYATTVGNGAATSFTIAQTAHGLATDGTILVQIMDATTGAYVVTDFSVNPTNGTVTITFTTAPATNAYRVLLIG